MYEDIGHVGRVAELLWDTSAHSRERTWLTSEAVYSLAFSSSLEPHVLGRSLTQVNFSGAHVLECYLGPRFQ